MIEGVLAKHITSAAYQQIHTEFGLLQLNSVTLSNQPGGLHAALRNTSPASVIEDKSPFSRAPRRESATLWQFVKMAAHPFMSLLLGLVAAAETGLLGYLVNTFEPIGYPAGQGDNGSPSQMRTLILLLLFTASWTTLFALCFLCFSSRHDGFLASIGASLLWLLITIALWAVSTTLFHLARVGGECIGSPTISVCRQLEAVEALGWTALGLCVLAVLSSLFTWHSRRRAYRGGYYV